MSYKHALVTGGAGFIGSHIVDALLDQGMNVTVIDDLSSGKRANVDPKADFYEMSILSENIDDVILEVEPDIVFHMAAQIDVGVSMEDPMDDAQVNILGALNVARTAAKAGVKRFVFPSTAAVLKDDTSFLPYGESTPVQPKAPYGIAKRSAEMYVDFIGNEYDMSTISLRFANVYGPRQDASGEGGVIEIFIKRMLADKPVTIFGDGDQTRDFIFVDDVVNACMITMEHEDVSGIYHIGTGSETTVNELYEVLSDISGTSVDVQRAPARTGDIEQSALDAQRAKVDLGWEPRTSLKDGLKITVEWAREERL